MLKCRSMRLSVQKERMKKNSEIMHSSRSQGNVRTTHNASTVYSRRAHNETKEAPNILDPKPNNKHKCGVLFFFFLIFNSLCRYKNLSHNDKTIQNLHCLLAYA